MQSISPNYNRKWSQTDKITEENLSQFEKLYLVLIAKNKDPSIRVKMHQTFFIFTTICLISAEWM